MQIELSDSAIKDISGIYEYLLKKDNSKAKPTIKNLKTSMEMLKEFPEKGRLSIVDGVRELVLLKLPYVIPYEIIGDTIYILRVYHTSRKPILYK